MTVDGSPGVEHQERSPRDERWYLTDERDFLERSLADADREREAGDLSDEDHAVLVARDRARLVEVEERAGRARRRASAATAVTHRRRRPAQRRAPAGEPAQPERPPMALWRKVGIVAACLLIAAGAVHPRGALRPGPPARASLVGQRERVAGPAD